MSIPYYDEEIPEPCQRCLSKHKELCGDMVEGVYWAVPFPEFSKGIEILRKMRDECPFEDMRKAITKAIEELEELRGEFEEEKSV